MTEPRCTRGWQIEARHDGRLQGADADAVVSHAERCADCRDEKRRFDSLVAILRRASEPRVDEMRRARLKQRVLSAADAALVRREGPRPWLGFAAVAAALALGAFGAFHATPSERRTATTSVVTRAIEGARFSRRTERGHEVIALVEGELVVRVRHAAGPRRSAVTVHVPDGVVRDEGTTFRVRVFRGHTESIVVTEGRVAFTPSEGAVVRVDAGERWDRAHPSDALRIEPAHEASRAEEAPAPHRRPATVHSAPAPAAQPALVEEDPAATESIEDGLYLGAIRAFRGGDRARARRLASSYLARFPSGFRRVEMQGLVASIPPE